MPFMEIRAEFFASCFSCCPGALGKVKLPRSRPSSGKKGKRAAWAKESETESLVTNQLWPGGFLGAYFGGHKSIEEW